MGGAREYTRAAGTRAHVGRPIVVGCHEGLARSIVAAQPVRAGGCARTTPTCNLCIQVGRVLQAELRWETRLRTEPSPRQSERPDSVRKRQRNGVEGSGLCVRFSRPLAPTHARSEGGVGAAWRELTQCVHPAGLVSRY